VVDQQSFPLPVPAFPELQAQGAYSKKQLYTKKDIELVIQYAAERGITVMMEVDMPGR
jgi:hexosaminidase